MSLLAIFKKMTHPLAFKQLAYSVAVFCVGIFAVVATNRIRYDGFAALTERSKPLLAAIKAYEAEHDAASKTLNELVPKYLSKIPGTGAGAYPAYYYTIRPGINWT